MGGAIAGLVFGKQDKFWYSDVRAGAWGPSVSLELDDRAYTVDTGEGTVYATTQVAGSASLWDHYRIDVTQRTPGHPIKINSEGVSNYILSVQPAN